jgi:hypothetical protein
VSGNTPLWWTFRRAQNLSASVYTCPLCDGALPALAEHMLITPEGDSSGRRHAHVECFKEARLEGRLPSIDEWKATQPRKPSVWKSIFRR